MVQAPANPSTSMAMSVNPLVAGSQEDGGGWGESRGRGQALRTVGTTRRTSAGTAAPRVNRRRNLPMLIGKRQRLNWREWDYMAQVPGL